jgi:hypothetical protein
MGVKRKRFNAVFLANLRELFIDFCIFFRPPLAMLGFQNVVLGVVDDLAVFYTFSKLFFLYSLASAVQ